MISSGTGAVLTALLAALFWGGGDFSGGMAVKAAGGSFQNALRVILSAHLLSLVVLAAAMVAVPVPMANTHALLWAATAGVAGGLGLIVFYLALAGEAMGAAAAVSGLLAAAIPAAVSAVIEGAPGRLRLVGFLLASLAIWIIAMPGSTQQRPATGDPERTLLLAVGGGVGFGLYFVALRFANRAGVVAPMAAARTASILLCSVLLLSLRRSASTPTTSALPRKRPMAVLRWLPRTSWLWVGGIALLDTGGNMLFIQSTRLGRLDSAAVLASLYPASTILLAAVLLHERPAPRQLLGMALAAIAVVFVAK